MLFGYAINTMPRNLPTAVLMQERTDLSRSILAALENTKFFKVTHLPHSEAEVDQLLASGAVLFAIEIPANFERSVRRGDKPSMLVIADATDPVASGTAIGALGEVLQMALMHDRDVPDKPVMPFEIRTHSRYNPAGVTQLNIVPGLVGTILTMTMLIFTALSVTREIERARYDGEPIVDADHAFRNYVGQDCALYSRRLRTGFTHHQYRRVAVWRTDCRQPCCPC
jgi:ABC-2 type transport system permease protein